MLEKMTSAIERQAKILYVDEAIFSPVTMLKWTWSLPNDNVKVTDLRKKVKTQAIVAGISTDKGLESFLIKERSIKNKEFIEFLKQLRELYPNDTLVLFLDNLSVHKSREVTAVYAELNIETVFCVPYSPQYNGIESYWFLIK